MTGYNIIKTVVNSPTRALKQNYTIHYGTDPWYKSGPQTYTVVVEEIKRWIIQQDDTGWEHGVLASYGWMFKFTPELETLFLLRWS